MASELKYKEHFLALIFFFLIRKYGLPEGKYWRESCVLEWKTLYISEPLPSQLTSMQK